MHPIGLSFFACIFFFFATAIGLVFCKSSKAALAVGFTGTSLMFFTGFAFSFMIHLLHVGMSGEPVDSPLYTSLLIVFVASLVMGAVSFGRYSQLLYRAEHYGC